jgi:hypothetical protein
MLFFFCSAANTRLVKRMPKATEYSWPGRRHYQTRNYSLQAPRHPGSIKSLAIGGYNVENAGADVNVQCVYIIPPR